jgi:hypothetical protein
VTRLFSHPSDTYCRPEPQSHNSLSTVAYFTRYLNVRGITAMQIPEPHNLTDHLSQVPLGTRLSWFFFSQNSERSKCHTNWHRLTQVCCNYHRVVNVREGQPPQCVAGCRGREDGREHGIPQQQALTAQNLHLPSTWWWCAVWYVQDMRDSSGAVFSFHMPPELEP